MTVSLAAGTGYAVAANASQATVTVEDDDAAPVIADTGPFTVDENGTAVVTLTATDDRHARWWTSPGRLRTGRMLHRLR